MKKCLECGAQNEDAATVCRECDAELASAPPEGENRTPWIKIATVDSEVEAEVLDGYLNEEEIPHVMISYNDAAFSQIYQATRGWGHVEAPPEHREEIEALLTDIREAAKAESDDD